MLVIQLITAPCGWANNGPPHDTRVGCVVSAKMDNRSGILLGECGLLCSLLLQVDTCPHDDAWGGGLVVSHGPGAHSSR